ncbi:MAG TPA: helix-turn-helix domain-containing protein [Collinsella aerofaciens]|nr:helix-turn-helix domain-containing protein [Collinsella aerofaciens]
MLERRASCREIARELGRSPSTVSAEVSSHRFVAAPKPRCVSSRGFEQKEHRKLSSRSIGSAHAF